MGHCKQKWNADELDFLMGLYLPTFIYAAEIRALSELVIIIIIIESVTSHVSKQTK